MVLLQARIQEGLRIQTSREMLRKTYIFRHSYEKVKYNF
jgi:hypothetical protein